jgi:predicted nucleic acid-binding protein
MENNRYVLDSLKRRNGQEEASQVISLIDSFPVSLENIDRSLALQTGDVKSTAAISLADCFCTAPAMKRAATVVTGDPEFDRMDSKTYPPLRPRFS